MSFVILDSTDFTMHFSELFTTAFDCAEHVQEAAYEYGPRAKLLIFDVETLRNQQANIEELATHAFGSILVERRGWITITHRNQSTLIALPRKRRKRAIGPRTPTVIWNMTTHKRYSNEVFPTADHAANAIGRAIKGTPNYTEGEKFALFAQKKICPNPNEEHTELDESQAITTVTVHTRCWLSLKHDGFNHKVILPLTPKQQRKLAKRLKDTAS